MKKILFALTVLPLLFFACSSDDEPETPKHEFDYNIEHLYGQWRVSSVELDEATIDLTTEEMEALVEPTYLTFTKEDDFSTKGVMGEGKGKFAVKSKTITTSINEEKMSFEVTALDNKSAKAIVNIKDMDFGELPIPEELEKVTLGFTKVEEK